MNRNNLMRVPIEPKSAIIYFSSAASSNPEKGMEGKLALDFDGTWNAAGAELEAIEIVKRIFPEHN